MGRATEIRVVAGFIGIIAIVIFLLLAGDTMGFDTTLATDLIQLIPSIVVIFIGAYFITLSSDIFTIGGFMAVGMGLAYMTETLNDMSILIPDLLSVSLTLTDLQLLLILCSALVGAAFAGVKRF